MSTINWSPYNPNNWLVDRVKNWFYIGRGRVISNQDLVENGQYPVYSSQTLNNGIMGYINTYDFNGSYITWTTDGVYAGTIFLRNGKFNCTNVCGTLLAKKDIHYPYVSYYLQYATEVYKRPDTNGAKIMNNEMAEIKLLIPPLDFQKRIADYLDKKINAIDSLIEECEKSIEGLKEYKISLISNILSENCDYSEKFKYLIKINDRMVDPSKIEYAKLPHICPEVIEKMTGKMLPYNLVEDEGLISGKYLFESNEVVYGKINPHLNKVCFPKCKGLCSADAYALSSIDNRLLPEFIYYTILSLDYYNYTKTITARMGMPKINRDEMNNYIVKFTSIEKQKQIIKYLDEKCKAIDELIEVKQKKIETLKEYKKSLIYECVTGKRMI